MGATHRDEIRWPRANCQSIRTSGRSGWSATARRRSWSFRPNSTSAISGFVWRSERKANWPATNQSKVQPNSTRPDGSGDASLPLGSSPDRNRSQRFRIESRRMASLRRVPGRVPASGSQQPKPSTGAGNLSSSRVTRPRTANTWQTTTTSNEIQKLGSGTGVAALLVERTADGASRRPIRMRWRGRSPSRCRH